MRRHRRIQNDLAALTELAREGARLYRVSDFITLLLDKADESSVRPSRGKTGDTP